MPQQTDRLQSVGLQQWSPEEPDDGELIRRVGNNESWAMAALYDRIPSGSSLG